VDTAPDKCNEITAIPELLDAPLLKSAFVTIDAMGCPREIAQRLVNTGAAMCYLQGKLGHHAQPATMGLWGHEARAEGLRRLYK